MYGIGINLFGQYAEESVTAVNPTPLSHLIPSAKPLPNPVESVTSSATTFNSKRSDTSVYLAQLNERVKSIAMLLQQTAKNKEPHSVDTLCANFDRTAITMQLSYHFMVQEKMISKKQVQDILTSTYFDSELETNGQVDLAPPNTHLTLTLLLEFLSQISSKSNEQLNLAISLRSCMEFFSLFKVAVSYLPKQEQVIRPFLVEWMRRKIERLKIDETMFLPGGWIALPGILEGHFSPNYIRRINETEFKVIHFQTHQDTTIKEKVLVGGEIKEFAANIVDQYLPFFLFGKLKSTQGSVLKVLLQNKDSKKNRQREIALPFTPQVQSFNCCFMSCFLFYQYLLLKNGCDDKIYLNEEALAKAASFRINFRNFLEKYLKSIPS